MRVLYGIFLAVFLILIFIFSYKKFRDIFSPLCIFALFQFLRYVPNMFFKEQEFGMTLNDATLAKTFIVEIAFIFAVCMGTKISIKNDTENLLVLDEVKEEKISQKKIHTWLIWTFFALGFLERLVIIIANGGILHIIKNMGRVYSNLVETSSGYLEALGILITISAVMMLEKSKLIPKKRYYFSFLLIVVLGMFSYFLFSKRSGALEILMIVVFAYNYIIKPIRIKNFLKPKYIMAVLLCAFLVVILPTIRNTTYESDISEVDIKEVLKNNNLFDEFSYLGRDTFIFNTFNVDNYWLGANFLNLAVGAIPSRVFLDKPALDDGVYICNWMYGYEVSPTTPYRDVPIKNSFPFSTQGCMYTNFGIIGVIIGGLILGILYRHFYKKVLKRRDGFSVIVYQLIVYQLELSTLSIVQTIVPLIICHGAYFIAKKVK